MTPDVFAEWLLRQGHKVIRTASSYWYNAAPFIYQSFPYHWLITPSEDELSELLKKERVLGFRYSTPTYARQGQISYHGICMNKSYELGYLSPNARSNIRRGLKRCQVEQISTQRLAQEGWELQEDTLDRQGRKGGLHKKDWERLCTAAQDLQGFEAWAAIVDGQMAASILVARIDDAAYLLYPQSRREYFRLYVNNALVFILTQQLLSRSDINLIFYGLHSLDAPASVDEFKFRMGYTAKPVKQRVVFHPLIAPLFNNITYKVIKALSSWSPSNPALAKTEGMVRFYLEGKNRSTANFLPPSSDKTGVL